MSNVLAALKSEARLIEREDEILTHLNRLIVDQVEPGRFVTFFYGVIDRVNGTLSYACAGHNPPLKMGANGHSSWLFEAGPPLGVLPETRYEPAVVRVESGDVIVLYSDGVTEAHRPLTEHELDAAEEPLFFEERRLEAIVRDNRDRTAAEIVSAIVDAVHSFTGGEELSDDLTLVVVRVVDAF
jgi:sigma-B regulation protein RsbU (phosphoserine phosphatase)